MAMTTQMDCEEIWDKFFINSLRRKGKNMFGINREVKEELRLERIDQRISQARIEKKKAALEQDIEIDAIIHRNSLHMKELDGDRRVADAKHLLKVEMLDRELANKQRDIDRIEAKNAVELQLLKDMHVREIAAKDQLIKELGDLLKVMYAKIPEVNLQNLHFTATMEKED